MFEALSHMLWPLLACFVLVGIHAYLGIHVIARKVIFVDLALAQIAALGAVYGVFIGLSFEMDSLSLKGVSVAFTLIGALLFSFTRTPDERVPHEAIIGIIYAAALSMTLLLTANLPHGADEVSQMLAGNILWVTPKEVIYTAILYSVVGAMHLIFRRQFFLLSEDIAHNSKKTLNIKLWDFLFYASFGVVVTSSVSMGGVLLVFGYLVIPSVIGIMLARSTKARLMLGWGSGVLMSLFGVVVSYNLDLPSGPTVVVLLGVLLTLITLIMEVKNKKTRKKGFIHCALTVVITSILIAIPIWFLGNNAQELHHDHQGSDSDIQTLKAALTSEHEEHVLLALNTIKVEKRAELLPDVLLLLSSDNDKIRERAVSTINDVGDKSSIPYLREAVVKERDEFIRIGMAESLLSFGDINGLGILQDIMTKGESEFARHDAKTRLHEWLVDAPLDSDGLSAWLNRNRDQIRYDDKIKKYTKHVD